MSALQNKLLVKNLPPELNGDDKTDLLKIFGAKEVTYFDRNGKMKNSAFASFPNPGACELALKRLHQLEILGCRLRVEYALDTNKQHTEYNDASCDTRIKQKQINENKDRETNAKKVTDEISDAIAPKLGVHHSFPKHLSYLYPPATVTTLTNIANALATVPRFYIQVLHLMNKMNLPPPFTGPTITPPLPDDTITLIDACVDTSGLCDFASSEESEIESDTEISQDQMLFGGPKTRSYEPTRKRKRLKAANVIVSNQKAREHQKHVGEAFEQMQQVKLKRIEFKLAANISASLNSLSTAKPSENDHATKDEQNIPAECHQTAVNLDGFGILEPNKLSEKSSDEEVDDDQQHDFISHQEIKAGKMTLNDLASLSQMKNYERGERTNRLYIKNLAKSTRQEELEFLFKRFIRHYDKEDKEKFQIRLMKEGRMKGQAFVIFPTDDAAEKALNNLHGFTLNDKPMIIQYGRVNKT